MKFKEKFDCFVLVGDSISLDIGSCKITATVYFDGSSKPDDFDCFNETEIKRWRDGDWFFCGIVLSAKIGDTDIPLSSLWGIEENYLDNNDYLNEVANDLLMESIPELLESIQKNIDELENTRRLLTLSDKD